MKRRSIVWTLALLTAVVGIWARQQMAIESRDQPATADDLRILRRADALLGDASVWNRHDDQVLAHADDSTVTLSPLSPSDSNRYQTLILGSDFRLDCPAFRVSGTRRNGGEARLTRFRN